MATKTNFAFSQETVLEAIKGSSNRLKARSLLQETVVDCELLSLRSISGKIDTLRCFGALCSKELKGKFISPTYWEKDKREILSVEYMPHTCRFLMKIKDSICLNFRFDQIHELVEIGLIQEDETDMVAGCYFIVK